MKSFFQLIENLARVEFHAGSVWNKVNHSKVGFFQCQVAISLWSFMLQRLNLSWVHSASINQLPCCWNEVPSYSWNFNEKIIWGCIPAGVCWCIWKARNARIF